MLGIIFHLGSIRAGIGNVSGEAIYVILLLLLPALGFYFSRKDYRALLAKRTPEKRVFKWREFTDELGTNDLILMWICYLGWGMFFMSILALSSFTYWDNKYWAILCLALMILGAAMGRFGEKRLKNQLKRAKLKKRKELKRRKELAKNKSVAG